MNKVWIYILVAVILIYLTYQYCYQNKEGFYEGFEDENMTRDLLIRKQVPYLSKQYDLNYVSTHKSSSLSNKNSDFSVWLPHLPPGGFPFGSAVSKTNDSEPEQKYTSLGGNELSFPAKYEKIFQHGRSPATIAKDITDNEALKTSAIADKGTYQEWINKYNSTNPDDFKGTIKNAKYFTTTTLERIYNKLYEHYRAHEDFGNLPSQYYQENIKQSKHITNPVALMEILPKDVFNAETTFSTGGWGSGSVSMLTSGDVTMVLDPGYYRNNKARLSINNPDSTYRKVFEVFGIDEIQLLPHMKVTIETYYKDGNGNLYWGYGSTLEGDYININTETKTKTFLRDDIQKKIKSDMDYLMRITYDKNPKALDYWTSMLTSATTTEATANNNLQKLVAEKGSQFSIWRPIPNKGYQSLGDMFVPSHLEPDTKAMVCVPERCSKEMRVWDHQKDRLFVLKSDDGKERVSIYANPFHPTFTTFKEKFVSGNWTPDETFGFQNQKILRLYPCLPKCSYIDSLIEADKCAKGMCLRKTKLTESVPLVARKASDEASKQLLEDIKEQETYLEELQKTVNRLEKDQHKFHVVNQEFNRHELQKFLDESSQTQKEALHKLFNSRHGVALNINSPGGLKGLKQLLMNYLKHHAKLLKDKKAVDIPQKELPAGCVNWTQFKEKHYCKKSNPPCFGCVNPT